MDEAERCHEIGYIAGGRLLVHGPAADLVRASTLAIWTVTGDDMQSLAQTLRGVHGITAVTPFGGSLHVSGPNHAAVKRAISPYLRDRSLRWEQSAPSLEDVFIDLIRQQKQQAA
jgi:ABC-2 type transport system ATP-binding protein